MIYANTKTDANMREHEAGETGAQLRERLGVKPRTFQTMWKRSFGYSFDANKVCSQEEISTMEAKYNRPSATVKTRKRITANVNIEAGKVPVSNEMPEQPANHRGRRLAMVTLMAAPAIASLQNMLHVTSDITNDGFSAALFTYAFTAAPFVFVVFRATGALSFILTGLLISVEVFCNTVRIYGGLTGFGQSGNPTRFLGIVTEIFNSGTYETAVFMASVLSLFAASVMYKAYFEYQKTA